MISFVRLSVILSVHHFALITQKLLINQAQIWWADILWGTDRFFQI